jgi:hypothetical protein
MDCARAANVEKASRADFPQAYFPPQLAADQMVVASW